MTGDDSNPFTQSEFDRDKAAKSVVVQMGVGAGLAAATILVPMIAIYLLYLVGTLLPPESKEAPDPTPGSFSTLQVEMPRYA
ncbi:MAG: RC-LH1 core complex protein PufX [Pseudomonadota bacterium]